MDLSSFTASVLLYHATRVCRIMRHDHLELLISLNLSIGGTTYSNTAAGNILRGCHDACFAPISLSGCGVILYALDGSRRQVTDRRNV